MVRAVPTADFEMLGMDDQHCLAAWRGLVVQCWNETRAAAVEDNTARARARRVADRGPIACFVILEPDAPPPDAPARKALERLADVLFDRCACCAYVYQGTGFRAAAVRGVMLALSMVKRSAVPTKICSSVTEALDFMAPLLTDEARFGSPAERARVVASIQARFAERPR